MQLQRERNGMIDAARLISALLIVWGHAGAPYPRVSHLALPFFLFLLGMPGRTDGLLRARRLLAPWLIWSAVYGLLAVAVALRNDQPPFGWAEPGMVFYGTTVHLWFLPFAAATALAAPWLRAHPRVLLAATLAAALVCAAVPAKQYLPAPQWAFALVPTLVGIAWLGLPERWRGAILATLLASWALLAILRPDVDNTVILLGTLIAMAVTAVRVTASRWTWIANHLAVSVYLAHPLAIFIGYFIGLSGVPLALFAMALVMAYAILERFLLVRVFGRRKHRRTAATPAPMTNG